MNIRFQLGDFLEGTKVYLFLGNLPCAGRPRTFHVEESEVVGVGSDAVGGVYYEVRHLANRNTVRRSHRNMYLTPEAALLSVLNTVGIAEDAAEAARRMLDALPGADCPATDDALEVSE